MRTRQLDEPSIQSIQPTKFQPFGACSQTRVHTASTCKAAARITASKPTVNHMCDSTSRSVAQPLSNAHNDLNMTPATAPART